MRMLRLSIVLLVALVTFCIQANPAASAQRTALTNPAPVSAPDTPPQHIYLAALYNGAGPTPSSIQLIDTAVAGGTISPETGLIYKVFAVFSDARLPSQYLGTGVGRAGDGVIADVVARAKAGTLSASALQTLTPFFVPPDHSGSWYALQRKTSIQSDTPAGSPVSPQSAAANWVGIKAAGNKVWIIWDTADAVAPAKAQGLKAALDAKIWSNLTTLMGRSPLPDSSGFMRIYLWNSYIDSDGTLVPFDANTLGITVGTRCDQSATVIYLPSRLPIGDETHPGMIQYATHELMHAIQFSYPIQNCGGYGWLKEATATWAEDFVYKDANSEWDLAPKFMNRADVRLDDRADLHDYGSYLLPYFLTHQFGDNSVIRKMWELAGTEPNSYLAVKKSLPANYQEYFWPLFLQALWNKTPFQEFYESNDKLVSTVMAKSNTAITTAGGEQEIPLNGTFETGAASFYHFSVNWNVSSLTILNGLGKKLSKGPASEVYTTDGDQEYQFEDLADSDAQGATLLALMKIAGVGWQMVLMGGSQGVQEESHSTCIDVQGAIEDLVIVQSNADFEHPDRVMAPKGLPTTVFANNMPCWKVTGTSKMTVYNAGVTTEYSAHNLVYSYPSALGDMPSQYPYVDFGFAYPVTQLALLGADVDWSISGTDSAGCAHSGSGSFHVSEQPGAGSDTISLFPGVLKGGPTYRGYQGQGIPESGTQITETISGKDCPPGGKLEAFSFLEIPLETDRANIKIPAGGGQLSGSYKRDEPINDYELMEWNLTQVIK
jgi:hypothetical protein